jgi:hypothetical protein
LLGSAIASVAPAASALPPPAPPSPPPRTRETPTPLPTPTGPLLPYGSPISFVLLDSVNSGSTPPGTIVHMKLQAPLIVGGVTLAPAGAPATFTVVTTAKAQTGDVDGAIQIHVDPFTLPGRDEVLPIRAYHEYLTVDHTTGQLTTRAAADQTADVFVPYYIFYQAFRKGRQMVLPVGSVLRAETAATVDARNPRAIVIATPPPFTSSFDPPHADLTAAPFYTPAPGPPHPLPKGKPTLPPRLPSPSPSPEASGADAGGSPAPAVSGALPATSSAAPATSSSRPVVGPGPSKSP